MKLQKTKNIIPSSNLLKLNFLGTFKINWFNILSSEIEASFLGCIAILPRFTNLSVVLYCLNQSCLQVSYCKNFGGTHPLILLRGWGRWTAAPPPVSALTYDVSFLNIIFSACQGLEVYSKRASQWFTVHLKLYCTHLTVHSLYCPVQQS